MVATKKRGKNPDQINHRPVIKELGQQIRNESKRVMATYVDPIKAIKKQKSWTREKINHAIQQEQYEFKIASAIIKDAPDKSIEFYKNELIKKLPNKDGLSPASYELKLLNILKSVFMYQINRFNTNFHLKFKEHLKHQVDVKSIIVVGDNEEFHLSYLKILGELLDTNYGTSLSDRLYKELPLFQPSPDKFYVSASKSSYKKENKKQKPMVPDDVYLDSRLGERIKKKYLAGEPIGKFLSENNDIYTPVVDNRDPNNGVRIRDDVVWAVMLSELGLGITPQQYYLDLYTVEQLFSSYIAYDLTQSQLEDAMDNISDDNGFSTTYSQDSSESDKQDSNESESVPVGKKRTLGGVGSPKQLSVFEQQISDYGHLKCSEAGIEVLQQIRSLIPPQTLGGVPLVLNFTGNINHSWITIVWPSIEAQTQAITGYNFSSIGGGVARRIDSDAYSKLLNEYLPDAQVELTVSTPDLFLNPNLRTWWNGCKVLSTKILLDIQHKYINHAEYLCIFDSQPKHDESGVGVELSSFLHGFKDKTYSMVVSEKFGFLTDFIFRNSDNCASFVGKILKVAGSNFGSFGLYRPKAFGKMPGHQIVYILEYMKRFRNTSNISVIKNFIELISDCKNYLQGSLGKVAEIRIKKRNEKTKSAGGSKKRSRRTLKKK